MDQLEHYRAIVRRLIEEYSSYKPAYGDIRTEAVVDREHDHYEVIQVGWNGDRRVHGSIIHIDIRQGKVWIEYNGTDAASARNWWRPVSPGRTSCWAFNLRNCGR